MTKSKTYRILAFMLAVLMFSTSVGFTIDMHFCQGNLAAISVFGEASCCKKACTSTKKACCQLPLAEKTDDNCCDNKSLEVELNIDIPKAETPSFSKSQIQFVAAFVATYFQFQTPNKTILPHQNYKPPLLTRNIPVLMQSFLC